jgi:tRNA G26 N,N-dimethylase Trm1
MSIESVARIMSRIKQAPEARPISVFVVTVKKVRKLDAIYGNTIVAKRRQTALKPFHASDKCPTCGNIETHFAEEWIGDFHNGMNLQEVRTFLIKATEK